MCEQEISKSNSRIPLCISYKDTVEALTNNLQNPEISDKFLEYTLNGAQYRIEEFSQTNEQLRRERGNLELTNYGHNHYGLISYGETTDFSFEFSDGKITGIIPHFLINNGIKILKTVEAYPALPLETTDRNMYFDIENSAQLTIFIRLLNLINFSLYLVKEINIYNIFRFNQDNGYVYYYPKTKIFNIDLLDNLEFFKDVDGIKIGEKLLILLNYLNSRNNYRIAKNQNKKPGGNKPQKTKNRLSLDLGHFGPKLGLGHG